MQLAFHHIPDLWPNQQDAPNFQNSVQCFMEQCNRVSQQLLECFALGLGFPEDFFTRCHDISQPDALNSLRFQHYFDLKGTVFDASQITPIKLDAAEECGSLVTSEDVNDYYRAGPHTDPDTLTLLFQNNPGHDALEACQGRNDVTQFNQGTHWLPLCPQKDELVCNIGDMLMRWSDDQLKSNFHRVKRPEVDLSSRYTIAYFTQANKSGKLFK
jgi:isopenicillin N synthase-like dioxygenase